MWRIQAERFKLMRSDDIEAPTLEAQNDCQDQIATVLQTHFKHLPSDLRPLLIHLRVNIRYHQIPNWKIALEERWEFGKRDYSFESGYFDNIFCLADMVFVAECKSRYKTRWILIKDKACNKEVGYYQLTTIDSEPIAKWAIWDDPVKDSPLGKFCIEHQLETGKQRSRPKHNGIVIEHIADTLLPAIEAYCLRRTPEKKMYFPIVVTTAQLLVADISKINLSSGRVEDLAVQEVDLFRFRKSLPTRHSVDDGVRTIVVMNPSAIVQYLDSVLQKSTWSPFR